MVDAASVINYSMFGAIIMAPPFRNFPLGIRLILMLCMFTFNTFLFAFLALRLVPVLFGITDAEKLIESIPAGGNEMNAYLFIQSHCIGREGL